VTHLIANEGELTIDRSDFPRASPRPGLRLTDLTANLILLTTFFAVSVRPWNDRNVRGMAVSALMLLAVHVAAVVVNVESIYALRLGPWSALHYGPVSRNIWAAAAHFYSVVGIFGAPFALWWLFRPPEGTGPSRPARAKRHRTQHRGSEMN
jgi:hypothetical protein